jgi:hypothetical protein
MGARSQHNVRCSQMANLRRTASLNDSEEPGIIGTKHRGSRQNRYALVFAEPFKRARQVFGILTPASRSQGAPTEAKVLLDKNYQCALLSRRAGRFDSCLLASGRWGGREGRASCGVQRCYSDERDQSLETVVPAPIGAVDAGPAISAHAMYRRR